MSETMEQFEQEIDASFRKFNEGDMVEGTVVSVADDEITVDLKSYAQGIVKLREISDDPSYSIRENITEGQAINACVLSADDGQGNILLSMKEAVVLVGLWGYAWPWDTYGV